jgi:hypothetical protein
MFKKSTHTIRAVFRIFGYLGFQYYGLRCIFVLSMLFVAPGRHAGRRPMTAKTAQSNSMTVIITGSSYFLIVFAIAFGLGVARGLLIAPRLGETVAVMLEIPVVLVVSLFVARRLIRGRSFSIKQVLAIGAIALALTLISEALLASMIRGQSIGQWAKTLVTPLGLIGLAGQFGFALMPTLIARMNGITPETL